MDWCWRGRAWVYGDDVPNDDGLMPLAMTRQQEYDPAVLATHCLEQVDPSFATGARPGDLVVGGDNFGHGNPHIQGFLGLKGQGVGLVVSSIGRGPLRACINAGVPVLQIPGVHRLCASGDTIEVDFASGRFRHPASGAVAQGEAMAPVMLDIVAAGGGVAHMVQRLGRPGVPA